MVGFVSKAMFADESDVLGGGRTSEKESAFREVRNFNFITRKLFS